MITLLTVLVAGTIAVPSELRFFPGPYFDAEAREHLQQRALRAWPPPRELLELWNGGTLDEPRRVALLLGAAAFHDPVMLPAYREGLLDGSPAVRRAAAYGYRDLLGDGLPNVVDGVPEEEAARIAAEVEAVARSLRRGTLLDLWLASALRTDEVEYPQWRGAILVRPLSVAVRAASIVARAEDVPAVVAAYRRAQSTQARAQLLRLVEALSLRRFLIGPGGRRAVWTMDLYREAFDRADAWLAGMCRNDDPRETLRASFAEMGLTDLDPFAGEACDAWWAVLERGAPPWWSTAAQQLYRCGAPYVELEVLQAESPRNRKRREILTGWRAQRLEELGLVQR